MEQAIPQIPKFIPFSELVYIPIAARAGKCYKAGINPFDIYQRKIKMKQNDKPLISIMIYTIFILTH